MRKKISFKNRRKTKSNKQIIYKMKSEGEKKIL